MSKSVVIPTEWQTLVSQELMAGETVVWAGSPSAEIIEENTTALVNLFYFLALGAFIYYIILPFREDGGFSFRYFWAVLSRFPLISIPSILYSLLYPSYYFVKKGDRTRAEAETNKSAFYLVTNYRALSFANSGGGIIIDRFLKNEIEEMQVNTEKGEIYFRDGLVNDARIKLGLFGIENSDEVIKALEQVKRIDQQEEGLIHNRFVVSGFPHEKKGEMMRGWYFAVSLGWMISVVILVSHPITTSFFMSKVGYGVVALVTVGLYVIVQIQNKSQSLKDRIVSQEFTLSSDGLISADDNTILGNWEQLASRRTVLMKDGYGDILVWTETNPGFGTLGREWRGVRSIEEVDSAELAIKSVLQ